MADNRKSTKPPVPPRRTKRKIKIAPIELSVASSSVTETTNDVVISQQKRPPPPPPPPLLPEKCRRNNSGYVEIRQPQCGIAATCLTTEIEQHHHENRVIDPASGIIEEKPRNDTTSARDNSSNSANDDPFLKSIVSKPSFLSSPNVASSKRNASNKYPSLFFTLHDFKNVVTDTWSRNDSVDPGDAGSQNLHEEESSKAHMLDDDSDVCFRVTTTNLPFEKCLSRWKDPFDDGDFVRKFDDCRFEDSKNENAQINDKRSSDFFDNDSKCHVGTKVRFVVESSSSSPTKRDSNVKIGVPCDSSRSHKSILNNEQVGEQSAASSVRLTEIQEEFADVKDCYDNTRDESYASSVEKGNSGTAENDLFIMEANEVDMKLKVIPQTHCDDRNNDVTCEKIHEEDFDLISWNAQTSDDCLKTGKENIMTSITRKTIISKEYEAKQVDQSNTSSGIAENVYCFTNKSLETACRIEEEAKITQRTPREEKMFLKKISDDTKEKCAKNEKIFFNESPQNFLNERNDDGSSKNISADDLVNKSVKIEQTRRSSEENKERSNSFENFKNNHEMVPPSEDIFAKNVPVKVRRNSFLETMLSDDSTDISMNCAIISATASTSMDKKLSTTNESPNQIRKLDADNTETERSRDFYMTEMDTKNQNILKNSKEMKEKIVKISNVKSTRSENKSASDVKTDVLNELLCNFNNIKLKIVSPENKESATNIGENISRPIAIDSRISNKKENASISFEKSRDEVCSVPVSTKTINANNDTIIIEKMVKEKDFAKIKTEGRPQDLKNDTSAISEEIAKKKNIEIKKPSESSCNTKSKIAKDHSKTKIDKNSSDIKTEEININTIIKKTSEDIKSAIEIERESKKSRDIRVSKTILKKTNVECERQQANEFQKRIPIGAAATMNKIFDSRELNIASHRNNLENGRKREKASRKIHTRGEEKTDEVIAGDEADDDRRIANRSALALVEDTSSGDKCAIVRKSTSINPCNNNDNNRAVTPVANVSNDQSFRDVVTITPGKVRSFVKYYEIRGDVTTVERHSKINDREKVARRKFTKSQAAPVAVRNSQRAEVITKEKETKDRGRSVKSNDLPRTANKIQPSTFAPRVSEVPLNNPVCKTTEMGSKEYEKSGSHISDEKTCVPFTKIGAKKSVQFLGGFTVIHSETFGEDESAGIVADRDTLRKRRAPGVPPSRDSDDYQKIVRRIAKSEKPPNEKDSLRGRKTVTQVSRSKTKF